MSDLWRAYGAVLFLGGSSGVAGDTLRYLRMLASLGHPVLCPDDFCGWPARLRTRKAKRILPGDNSDYWEQNLMYEPEPSSGELVYESCAKLFTSSDRPSMVYDYTLKVKYAALTKVVQDLPEGLAARGVYLAGGVIRTTTCIDQPTLRVFVSIHPEGMPCE